MDIWDNKEMLDKLEAQRAWKRKVRRLTFDCIHSKVNGRRVHCSKGLVLGQAFDGSVALITVLRGLSSGTCRVCTWYETDED